MKKVWIALLSAGVLALGACGGSEETNTAGNAVEEYNVASDDLGVTDNLALPADLDAVDAGNLSTDLEAADANAAAATTEINSAANSQ